MSINRHNYEEFFILYMDNELKPEERRMVESFVQQHPDLKEELDVLMQYKLVPDVSVVFPGKDELLKENGHSLITPSNYEEWLTLYADNELSPDQKEAVEHFIAGNPVMERELELVLKTRLVPETISFPDKALLYRTEEKRRIVPIRWRAAAAILILLLGVTAVLVLNRKGNVPQADVAGNQPSKQSEPQKEQPVLVKENNDPVIIPTENKTTDQDPVALSEEDKTPVLPLKIQSSNAVAENKNKTVLPVNVPVNDPSPVIKKDEPVVADINNKPTNNLPRPVNNPNLEKQDKAIADITIPDEKNNTTVSGKENVTKNNPPTSDNYILASNNGQLEQPDGKKNKNRGIFRKIARTFEKRTSIDPTDDDRLLVGGLAIKLK
jgi:hypothetical protein